jgi:hypothetical protein
MPHIAHMVMGVIFSGLFIAMVTLFTIGQMDLKYTTRNLVATMHIQ